MLTVDAVIDDLGGTGALATAIDADPSTVSVWRSRGFIPAHQWPGVVKAALSQGKRHITYEALAALLAGKPNA